MPRNIAATHNCCQTKPTEIPVGVGEAHRSHKFGSGTATFTTRLLRRSYYQMKLSIISFTFFATIASAVGDEGAEHLRGKTIVWLYYWWRSSLTKVIYSFLKVTNPPNNLLRSLLCLLLLWGLLHGPASILVTYARRIQKALTAALGLSVWTATESAPLKPLDILVRSVRLPKRQCLEIGAV